jgi:hypothetical protein
MEAIHAELRRRFERDATADFYVVNEPYVRLYQTARHGPVIQWFDGRVFWTFRGELAQILVDSVA